MRDRFRSERLRRAPARLTGAAALACLTLGASAIPASAVNIQVLNDSGQSPQNVYLMLDGGSSSDGQLVDDVPTRLSQITDSTFSVDTISAGRLYVSYGAPVDNAEPPSYPTRYDKIELTDPGVANLTAVDFFGIPMDMQALDGTGAMLGSALTYRCHTATILPQLRALAPSAEVDSGGQFVRFLSPQLSAASYGSMTPYVASLAGQTIDVNDGFFGTPYQTLSYSGTMQPDGSITLNGTITTPSTGQVVTGSAVHIGASALATGVYTGDTNYTVAGVTENVGFNNQYAVVYRDVVAGFALGYWGGRYGNNSADWLGQPDFAAARLTTDPFIAYDQYGATIDAYSGAYGYSFHDVGPTAVTVPLGSSTATLRLTIDSDQGPDTPGCVGASTPSAPPAPTTPPAPSPSPAPAPAASPPVAPSPPPAAATPGGTGRVNMTVESGSATLTKAGRALIALGCGGDPCKGSLTLNLVYSVRVTSPRRRPPGRRRAHMAARPRVRFVRRTLVLAGTDFSIEEGNSERIWVTISTAGIRRISDARGHRLGVLARASVGPWSKPTLVAQRRVTLQSYAPPRGRGRGPGRARRR